MVIPTYNKLEGTSAKYRPAQEVACVLWLPVRETRLGVAALLQ